MYVGAILRGNLAYVNGSSKCDVFRCGMTRSIIELDVDHIQTITYISNRRPGHSVGVLKVLFRSIGSSPDFIL